MKKVLAAVCAVWLGGCATTNYSEIDDSQAVISNLKIEEVGKAGTDKHQLDVEFDYNIEDYQDVSDLYTCSVLFTLSEGKMITISNDGVCQIDSESGSISTLWDTPFSSSVNYRKEDVEEMKMPLKYHVAIHQKKTSNTNIIIGMSEPLYLNPEVE